MKICVITPYFETREDWVRMAHASVRQQTIEAHHIMVCDGSRPVEIPDFRGTHIILQRNYRDYGNTPRFIGCYQALAIEADAIAFLDADNWYHPDHLEGLLRFVTDNRLDAAASARNLHRLDGSWMIKCPHVDGANLIDTSCLLVMKSAFRHLVSWVLLSQEVSGLAPDQYVWQHMRDHGARLGFLDRATIAYRTRHAVHYALAGEPPPPDAVTRTDVHGDRYQ